MEEVAGGFQLLSRQRFGSWLRRLHQSTIETRLSSPALETLAIVAYRQPVLRAEIEAIRGVQCGEMLRQLMERDLVRIGGRSEELGRPFFYSTTRRFLQVFGLRHLDELPRADDLRARAPPGAGTHASPETQSPETALSEATQSEALSGNEPFSDLTFQKVSTEESEVTIAADPELAPLQELDEERTLAILSPRASDDDFEEEEEEVEDDDEDDEDDDDDDEEDDEEFDDDFDDDDWEEVDDEEGDDEDDEEDDDWEDDEEDDDWEEDDDEEEEEWEDEKEEK